MLQWRGSAHAFPFGEGGTASAVTEEVQYNVAFIGKLRRIRDLFTSPDLAYARPPSPKGEGFDTSINCNVANSIRRAVTRDHSGYFTRVIPAQSPRLEVTPAARRAITNILPSSQEGCNRYKVAFEKNIYFTYESFSIPNG